MRKALWRVSAAALALLLIPWPVAWGCDHVQSGEGRILYLNPIPETEDTDGHTGPGTCSVCGDVLDPGHVIPKRGRQESGQDGPVMTAAPTAAPTAVPTAVPTLMSTAVPTPVSTPMPTAEPTAIPTPVIPFSGQEGPQGGGPTAQPDLADAASRQDPAEAAARPNGQEQGSGAPPSKRSSGGSGAKETPGRDLTRYPFFSERFPWRRLRMTPGEGIIVRLAGVLRWPLPEAASPLQRLFSP